MADKKISELTKLSSNDLDHRNDVIPIVDISSNTTKKIAPSGMPISGFAGAGTAATKNVGIGNTNVLQANAAVSDDDFLKVDGTSVEGRSVAEVKSDLSLGNVHSLNTGIGNNNVLVSRGNLVNLDFIRVTGSHLTGRSFSEVRTDLGLGNGFALNTGISNTNILVANNAVANDDFLKVDGVNVEGRSVAEVRTDLGLGNGFALNTGITNTSILVANDAVANDDFLKVDGVNIEGRSVSEVRTDLGLGNGYALNTGIANTNILVANNAVANDDFLKVDGVNVEGRSVSEVRTDLGLGNGYALNTGIANTNILVANNAVADNDFLKVDGVNVEGRTAAEVRSDLGLTDANITGIVGIATATGDVASRTVGIGNTNILSSNANVSDNDFLKIDGTSVEGRTAAQVRADLSLNNDVVTGSKDTLKERLNLKQSAYNVVVTGSNFYAGDLGRTRFGNGFDPVVNQISIETNHAMTGVISGSGIVNIGSNEVRAFNAVVTTPTNRYGLQDGHRLFRKGRVTTLQISNVYNILDTAGHGAYNSTTTGSMIIGKRITISGYPIASFNRTDYQVVAQTGGNGTLTLTGISSDYAALADATGVNKSNGAGVTSANSNDFAVFTHFDAPPVSIGHKNVIGGECSTVIGQKNEIRNATTNGQAIQPKSVCVGSENKINVSHATLSAYYGPNAPANLTVIGHGNGGNVGPYGKKSALTALGSNNFMGGGTDTLRTAVGSFNTFGNYNGQGTSYPGGMLIGHGNRSDYACSDPVVVGKNNFANSYRSMIFGHSNKSFNGQDNILIGKLNNSASGPNTLIGHSNTFGANVTNSIALGRNVKLGGESTLQGSAVVGGRNIAEVGWWNTVDDPRSRVRLDGSAKMVSMTIRDSSSAPVTGGAHHGSEPSGALGANMFTIQRNADAVTLFCNLGTGIKKIALGNLNQ